MNKLVLFFGILIPSIVNCQNNIDMSCFQTELQPNQCILIGESMHSMGNEIKLKSEIFTNILNTNRNIVFLFENFSFIDLCILNRKIPEDSIPENCLVNEYLAGTHSLDYFNFFKKVTQKKHDSCFFHGIDIFKQSYFSNRLIENIIELGGNSNIETNKEFVKLIQIIKTGNAKAKKNRPYIILSKYSTNKIIKQLDLVIPILLDNDLLKQVLKNINIGLKINLIKNEKGEFKSNRKSLSKFIFLRDSMMADNIKWLSNYYYKRNKLIISASNYHISSGLNSQCIRNKNLPQNFTLRDRLEKEYKNKIFTIGLTSKSGTFGYVFDSVLYSTISLQIRNPGCLESKAFYLNDSNSQVFLNKMKISEITEFDYCPSFAILGIEISCLWYNVFDSIILLKNSSPALFVTIKKCD